MFKFNILMDQELKLFQKHVYTFSHTCTKQPLPQIMIHQIINYWCLHV